MKNKNNQIKLRLTPTLPLKFFDSPPTGGVWFGFWRGQPPLSVNSLPSRDRFFEFVALGKVIGVGGIYKRDDISQSAELAGFLRFGERNRLLMIKQAVAALTDWGFAELNLHRIYLSFSDDEVKLISAIKSLGYRADGKLRDYFYHRGTYHDLVMLSLLKNEK